MRQRITFIHRPDDAVDPASLRVSDKDFTGPDIQAVREERYTLGLDELPDSVARLLRASHELHIRWVSQTAHETLDPLSSRLSPGFHVFYTPEQGAGDDLHDSLCNGLMDVFGRLQCTARDSITQLPTDRFSHSAAFHYYQLMRDVMPLLRYLRVKLCTATSNDCLRKIRRLDSAASIDFDYDTISHVLKITALWPHGKYALSVAAPAGTHRTEVGILTRDTPSTLGDHDLGIQGVLAVLGEHTKPSVTAFAFPSRHRHSAATFSASFLEPAGLHPTLQLKINSSRPPGDTSYCAPHAYFTLPKTIFPDRYQFTDDLFLRSKNLSSLRYASEPIDLEAPAYRTDAWGSDVLLELQPPTTGGADGLWTAEVPLHLRYGEPTEDGYLTVQVPYPVVFWACAAEEGTKFPNNPFERANLGYDALFGPRTIFWHLNPQPELGGSLLTELKVPVLMTKGDHWIGTGTALVVFLGFGWVVWSLTAGFLLTGHGARPPPATEAGGKETVKKAASKPEKKNKSQ